MLSLLAFKNQNPSKRINYTITNTPKEIDKQVFSLQKLYEDNKTLV